MKLLERLTHGDIIIAPYEVKKKILLDLSASKTLHKFRFYSKNEIIERVFYSYDLNTIMYLVEKHDLLIENAIMYLDNMYFVENKEYNNEKLNYLVSLKKELTRMQLIKIDELFINTLKGKNIKVIGYELTDDLFSHAIRKLKNITNVDIIKSELKPLPELSVFHYSHLNDEVNGVANKIASLLDQGININKIKLANVDDSYSYAINKIFSLYNIPVNLNNKTTLSELKMTKSFLDKFYEKGVIKDSLNHVTETFNLNDVLYRDTFNYLIRTVNKIIGVSVSSKDSMYKLLSYLLKNTSIDSNYFDNAVEIIDLSSYLISDDDHVFILNFNEESCPKKYKDKEYLNDALAPLINITTVLEKNQKEKDTLIRTLSNIKNLYISYHDNSSFNVKRPSLLINELNMKVINPSLYQSNLTYSPLYDQILLAKKIDEYNLYHYKDPLLDKLYANYHEEIDKSYQSFDNRYKKVNYIEEDNHNLSYSKLDTFFSCNFRYYLEYILKIGEFETSFYQYIGNLFHYVLSRIDEDDFDVDTLFDEYVLNNSESITVRERTLLIRLRQELKDSVEFIKEHLRQTEFKIVGTEQEILTKYDDRFNLKAIIDKVMTYEDKYGNKHLVIIDYKTGEINNKLDHIKDGINIQLPFYFYIIKQDERFKDYHLAGIYLESIIAGNIAKDEKKNYLQLRRDALKLNGYSTSDREILNVFDNSFSDSKFIKSMKLKNDGEFYRYAKVLDEEKAEELHTVISDLLKEATDKIRNADFAINPIEIKKSFESCKFCKYEDVCFKTFRDYRQSVVVSESEGEEDESPVD